MQPAAAEIKRETRSIGDGPGPPAQPRTRLDDQAIDGGLGQPPAGRNAGRAAADDYDFGIAVGHCKISTLFQGRNRETNKQRPVFSLAHDPEKWEPVFGKDQSAKRNRLVRYLGPKNCDPTMTNSQIVAYTPNARINISIPIEPSHWFFYYCNYTP
jgi:hypothetical protein